MTRTFLHGYATTRRTLAELETRPAWNRVHPEMRQRVYAMWVACQDAGYDAGLGVGYRSSAQQRTLHRSRHTEVPAGTSGASKCDGKWWRRNPGASAAACPDNSFHEETDLDGWCYAVDVVPGGAGQKWMNANAQRFGLHHFANVNNEPWHFQPIEFPNARSQWRPNVHVLTVWTFPGIPPVAPTPPPPITPPFPDDPFEDNPPEDNDMLTLLQHTLRPGQDALFVGYAGFKVWIATPEAFWFQVEQSHRFGRPFPTVTTQLDAAGMRNWGPSIGPQPSGTDEYGVAA